MARPGIPQDRRSIPLGRLAIRVNEIVSVKGFQPRYTTRLGSNSNEVMVIDGNAGRYAGWHYRPGTMKRQQKPSTHNAPSLKRLARLLNDAALWDRMGQDA